jgi:hypothetical protein
MSVEDIILDSDSRGISKLKAYLPPSYCHKAATAVLNCSGTVFIITGFYIASLHSPETDGPPGAIALSRALKQLGYTVYFITDHYSTSLMRQIVDPGDTVIEFPITNDIESERFASELNLKYHPSLLIATERCGLTSNGTYLNMHGTDISECNARMDHLFYNHTNTIGVGDGGNEIGMGKYSEAISKIPGLPDAPCVTRTTHTIIASTSNWGCYGLVAEISKIARRNLLILPAEEEQILKLAVSCGAVDGITKRPELGVDGFDMQQNRKILSQLHQYIVDSV